jgi:hypothetical protein
MAGFDGSECLRAPSLTLPRYAGEGPADIPQNLDAARDLLPLPRSGGGLGRGPSGLHFQ